MAGVTLPTVDASAVTRASRLQLMQLMRLRLFASFALALAGSAATGDSISNEPDAELRLKDLERRMGDMEADKAKLETLERRMGDMEASDFARTNPLMEELTVQLSAEKATVASLTARLAALESLQDQPPPAAAAAAAPLAFDPRIQTLRPDARPPAPDRRRTTAEGPAPADLPGVPITANDKTKTLEIGGNVEITGDAIFRGRVYVANFTQVGAHWVSQAAVRVWQRAV